MAAASSPASPPATTLTGLSISGPTSVTVGQTGQYSATGVYSDGSSLALTSGATWSTSNTSLATITQSGLLTAGGAGTVTVQTVSGGLNAQYTVSQVAPTSTSATTIYVSPSGVDTNPGTQSSPVRTIQRGVNLGNQANAAGKDAMVSIAGGLYRESVAIGSLNTTKTLTLQGAGLSTVLTGADDWSTGWTSQGDGSYAHSWPYNWGLKALPAGWDGYGIMTGTAINAMLCGAMRWSM